MVDEVERREREREKLFFSQGGEFSLSLFLFESYIGEPLYTEGQMGVVAVTVFAQWELRILAG